MDNKKGPKPKYTPEERKQKYNEYMRTYYQKNREKIRANINKRNEYLRQLAKNAPPQS